MNQQCGYYGKLLYNACVVEVPQLGYQSRQEIVAGNKHVKVVPPAVIGSTFVIIFAASFISALSVGMPWWGGLVGGGILGAIVAAWLDNMTRYEQPVYQTVTDTVEVGRSKCCIACRQAVEHLHRSV